MASKSEINEHVARESVRRSRLAVPALAGGVLYLLSGIIISSTLNNGPTVGLLQGLSPALHGEANPPVSPRAAEVKFTSHQAFGLIAGSTLAAIAIGALTLVPTPGDVVCSPSARAGRGDRCCARQHRPPGGRRD